MDQQLRRDLAEMIPEAGRPVVPGAATMDGRLWVAATANIVRIATTRLKDNKLVWSSIAWVTQVADQPGKLRSHAIAARCLSSGMTLILSILSAM
jgi:hypothetical protein